MERRLGTAAVEMTAQGLADAGPTGAAVLVQGVATCGVRDLGSGTAHGQEWRQGTANGGSRAGGGGGGGLIFIHISKREGGPPFSLYNAVRKPKGQFRYNSEIYTPSAKIVIFI